MKANIEIEFESFGDLTTALYEAIKGVKKEAKRQLPEIKFALRALGEPKPFEVQDDNCYGSFEIAVKFDVPTVSDLADGKEVPEELIGEMWEKDNSTYGKQGINPHAYRFGAIAMYHKMQEEIEKQESLLSSALATIEDQRKRRLQLDSDNGILQSQLLEAKKQIESLQSDLTAMINEALDKSKKLDEVSKEATEIRRHTIDSLYQQILAIGVEFDPAARGVFHQVMNSLTAQPDQQ